MTIDNVQWHFDEKDNTINIRNKLALGYAVVDLEQFNLIASECVKKKKAIEAKHDAAVKKVQDDLTAKRSKEQKVLVAVAKDKT